MEYLEYNLYGLLDKLNTIDKSAKIIFKVSTKNGYELYHDASISADNSDYLMIELKNKHENGITTEELRTRINKEFETIKTLNTSQYGDELLKFTNVRVRINDKIYKNLHIQKVSELLVIKAK